MTNCNNYITAKLLPLLICLLLTSPAAGRIIYVDDGANGISDGSSWANAYNDLQDALSTASSGDQIWVGQGTYKPDLGGSQTPGDREATFQLINSVGIYGGFAGDEDPATFDLDNRDFEANKTILTGDLNGDDVEPIPGSASAADYCGDAEPVFADFYYEGSMEGATNDGFSSCGRDYNLLDVWYAYTANFDGEIRISVIQLSQHLVKGSVHSGCPGTVDNELACEEVNYDIQLSVVSGNTYYIRVVGSEWYPTCRFELRILDKNDNSNHVVTGSNTNETAILDGFTITSASDGGMYNYGGSPKLNNCTFIGNSSLGGGGGMQNDYSSPTLLSCTFTNNSARFTGAGIFNMFSHPTITNCVFKDNWTGGREGGGIYNDWYSNPTITNCVFSGNSAEAGGGIYIRNSSPTITNCTFSQNSAIVGGGICNVYYSSPMIINCKFINNSVEQSGGGMYSQQYSNIIVTNCSFIGNSAPWWGGGMGNSNNSPTVTNCTFSGNWAGSGGGGGGMSNIQTSDAMIKGCVLWGNTAQKGPQVRAHEESSMSVDYCNIQGGMASISYDNTSIINWVEGNIDMAPLLTPDRHLLTRSLCIDAGDPNFIVDPHTPTDIDGDARVVNGRVDIGADEFLDTDGDRLPDWWERKYFGDANAANPNADPDRDMLSNLDEYEQYSSNPIADPYFVSNALGDDSYDGLAPVPGGGNIGPKKTIQAGIDAAGDGDTVLVVRAIYSGEGNYELDFGDKSITVLAPRRAIINCGNAGRAIKFDDPGTSPAVFAVLDGFTIVSGNADLGGAIRTVHSRLMFKDCLLKANTATDQGGGIYTSLSNLTFNNLVIRDNVALVNEPNAGLIQFSSINLQGALGLELGRLDLYSSWFYGPGRINLSQGTLLKVSGDPDAMPSVIRADVNGPGDIEIDAGQQLVIEGDAVVNLGGSGKCNPDPNTGGHIIVEGSLVVRGNASLVNSDVNVVLLDIEGANDIQYNNITLLEASTGFGGEFFADQNATISCNTIISEGDRYLDLDPDPDNRNVNISNNYVTVIIKEGTLGSQGTLLELRAADYDCNTATNPECRSGAYQIPADSNGFTDDPSENWVLESLILEENSKLNLTNRQGFEFQDLNDPNVWTDIETVYVKELVMGPNAILNTALQTVYYQKLVEPNGTELIRDSNDPFAPLANGSRFEDIPLLGFSLGIIAMDDITPSPHNEFDIRVRTRLRDPSDIQPEDCETGGDCLEGLIERIDDPRGTGGVMEMRTNAHYPVASANSVAAKGAFARAGDENITITFEYMFLDDFYDEAELIVYLSDEPDVGDNLVEVARIRPPAPGRSGSIGGSRFAVFSGTFRRGDLNFTRGTYVELELRGTDVHCLIDNWDPSVNCIMECGNYHVDGFDPLSSAVNLDDYMILLAEFGLAPVGVEKACLDLVTDGCINISDLIAWSPGQMSNMCPLSEASVLSEAMMSDESRSISEFDAKNAGVSQPLLICGKPATDVETNMPASHLYDIDAGGACGTDAMELPSNGRLITDSYGNIYQIDGYRGLMRLDGSVVVGPREDIVHEANLVSVGLYDVGVSEQGGFLLSDAAFDPIDANIVYVVPVEVDPQDGNCPYMAAAKLRIISDDNYEVQQLYGTDPAIDSNAIPTNCDSVKNFVYEPDLQHLHEIEIDPTGKYLFILSAHWLNSNNWVMIYDETRGNVSQVRIPLSEPNLVGPTAMVVSSFDEKLYLAPSDAEANDLTAKVYRFSIDTTNPDEPNLIFDGTIDINCPLPSVCPSVCDADLGYTATIVSMTENPGDGTLYVSGFTAPKFPAEGVLPYGQLDGIFTTPMLAVLSPEGSEPVVAAEIIGCDLALPFSILWAGNSCGGADFGPDGTVDSLDLAVIAQYWLEPNCAAMDNCGGADLDNTNTIDMQDLAIFAHYWLQTGCTD